MQIAIEKIQKISAHLPKQLLYNAQSITDKSITETLKLGLEALILAKAYQTVRNFKGRVKFTIDLNTLRDDK
jgi:hypothetical protein